MQNRPQSLEKFLKKDISSNAKLDDASAQDYFKLPHVNRYIKAILGNEAKEYITNSDFKKLKEAYDKAHDIRKFEIELYWKRTTYVWTLIAALITVCGVLLSSYFRLNLTNDTQNPLLVVVGLVAIFGLFITVISERILQSGEYWQKNWEYHVNLLEPLFSGKLYGTLLNSKNQRYSISKLNNLLYKLVLFVWILVAEAIYKIVYDTQNFLSFITPLFFFAISVAMISTLIDFTTRRKSKTATILLSQWDVAISDKETLRGRKLRFIKLRSKKS